MYRALCASPLNFAKILMIFCTQVSWVVPECSAKFGTESSRFPKMAGILNFKNHTFALLSQNSLVITKKLSRDIGRGKCHLVRKFDLKQP